jgi:hypothetical protein
MTMEIIEVIQNSPEWTAARLGLVTASAFSDVLAKGDGKTRKSLLYKLAAERITGEPTESFKSPVLDRGHALEDEARRLYAFTHDADPTRVGFVKNGDKGCSPDSFLGENGILEIKTQRGDLLIDTLFNDRFPPAHVAQCQGALWVCEREWIDIAVYWPKMPMFVKRATRDVAFIAQLSRAVTEFNEELAVLVEKIRRYGAAPSREPLMSQLRASVDVS